MALNEAEEIVGVAKNWLQSAEGMGRSPFQAVTQQFGIIRGNGVLKELFSPLEKSYPGVGWWNYFNMLETNHQGGEFTQAYGSVLAASTGEYLREFVSTPVGSTDITAFLEIANRHLTGTPIKYGGQIFDALAEQQGIRSRSFLENQYKDMIEMLQDKGSFLGVYLNEGAILLGKLDVRFAIYTNLGQLFPPFPHQIITQGMLFETCILDINSPTRNSQTGESAPGEDKSIDAPFSYGTPIFADEILKMKMDPVKLGFYKWLAEHDRNP